jgi:hypothetical protein
LTTSSPLANSAHHNNAPAPAGPEAALLNHKPGPADFGAIILAFAVTFFLNAAFTIPRLMSMSLVFTQVWGSSPVSALSHNPTNVTAVYEFLVFLFALPAGFLAIAATRVVARNSDVGFVCVGVSSVMLLYAIATLALRGRVLSFCPVYLDLTAALPGWFIGYFMAGGGEAFEFSKALPAALSLGIVIISAAVAIEPSYLPFYMPVSITRMQPDSRIETFHPVQEQSQPQQYYRPPQYYQPPQPDAFSQPFRPSNSTP